MIEINSYTQNSSCSKLEQDDTNRLVGEAEETEDNNTPIHEKSQNNYQDSNKTESTSTSAALNLDLDDHDNNIEINGVDHDDIEINTVVVDVEEEQDEESNSKSSSTPSLESNEQQQISNNENEDNQNTQNCENTTIATTEAATTCADPVAKVNNNEDAVLYPDNSGVNTEEFIRTTLIQNPKDRLFMLTIEKQLIYFLNDEKIQSYRFDAMNPYHRMLVHRIGAYFGLRHNVDQTKQCVIVSKNEKSRVPSVTFQSLIPTDQETNSDDQTANNTDGTAANGDAAQNTKTTTLSNKKQILKREISDQDGHNKTKFNNKAAADNVKPTRTYEEKSAEYMRVKNRIFNPNNNQTNTTTAASNINNNNNNRKLNDASNNKIISHSSSASHINNNKNDTNKSQPQQQQQQQQQITILNRQQQKGPNNKNLNIKQPIPATTTTLTKSQSNNINKNNYQNSLMNKQQQQQINANQNLLIGLQQQQQQQHGKMITAVPGQQQQALPPHVAQLQHYSTIPINQLHHAANIAAAMQQQQAPQTQSLLQATHPAQPQYIQYPTVYSPSNVEHHMGAAATAPHQDFQYRFQSISLNPNDANNSIQYYNHVQSQNPQMSYYFQPYLPVQHQQSQPTNTSNPPPPQLYQNMTASVHTTSNLAVTATTNPNNPNSNTTNTSNGLIYKDPSSSQQQQQQQVYVNKVQQAPVTAYHLQQQQNQASSVVAAATNNSATSAAAQYYQNSNNTSHITSSINKTTSNHQPQYNNTAITVNKQQQQQLQHAAAVATQMHPHSQMQAQYSIINPAAVYPMTQAPALYQPHSMHSTTLQQQQPPQQVNNNKYNHQLATKAPQQQYYNQNLASKTAASTMQIHYNNKGQNIRQPTMNPALLPAATQLNLQQKNSQQQYLYQQNNAFYPTNHHHQVSYYAQQQPPHLQTATTQQPYNSYNNNRNKNPSNYNNNINKNKVSSYQRPMNNNNNKNTKYNNNYNKQNSYDSRNATAKNYQQQEQENGTTLNTTSMLEAFEYSSGLTLSAFKEYLNKFNNNNDLFRINLSYMKNNASTSNDYQVINEDEMNEILNDDKDLTHLTTISNQFIYLLLLNFNNHEQCRQFHELFMLNQPSSSSNSAAELETIINENNLRSLFKLRYFYNSNNVESTLESGSNNIETTTIATTTSVDEEHEDGEVEDVSNVDVIAAAAEATLT